MKTHTIQNTERNALEALAEQAKLTARKYTLPAEELVQVASWQKILIWTVMVMVPLTYLPVPFANQAIVLLATATLHVLGIVAACNLAHRMHLNVHRWFWATAFPLLNLIAFSQITTEATFILRFNGLRPGIAGVSRKQMQKFGNPGPDSPTEVWNSPHNP